MTIHLFVILKRLQQTRLCMLQVRLLVTYPISYSSIIPSIKKWNILIIFSLIKKIDIDIFIDFLTEP